MSQETNGDFLEEKPQQKEASTEEQSNIAFKDFKGAVTTEEFLAVLSIAKEEYERLKRTLEKEKEFFENLTGSEMMHSSSDELPPELKEKLTEGFKRYGKNKRKELFSKEISRHKPIVDFINRFNDPSDELEYLTL